jgi:hypothetical protein
VLARFEVAFFAACVVAWVLAFLIGVGAFEPGTALGLDFYRFFSLAAVTGWLVGNLFVLRSRVAGKVQASVAWAYLTGPPAFFFLLRAFESSAAQAAAPLVAIYATLMYWLFFAVPWSLRAR